MNVNPHWFVYLARCKDDSLYCGIALNVEERIKAHSAGRGAKYTRSRGPVTLVLAVGPFQLGAALKIEAATKNLPANKKVGFLKYYLNHG